MRMGAQSLVLASCIYCRPLLLGSWSTYDLAVMFQPVSVCEALDEISGTLSSDLLSPTAGDAVLDMMHVLASHIAQLCEQRLATFCSKMRGKNKRDENPPIRITKIFFSSVGTFPYS